MTRDKHHSDGGPLDHETLETEFADLIKRAREADLTVEGAYDVRSPWPEETDYTVEISPIAKRTTTR